MNKYYFFSIIFLVTISLSSAQNNFFKTPTSSQLQKKRSLLSNIKEKRVYSLDEKGLRAYLQKAPMEFQNNGVTIPLEIPLPDGSVEIFNMVESPILSPTIAAQNPEIKTYSGNGTKNTKASIRLSLTSAGFNAIILNIGDDAVYFDSYSTENNNVYFNYFSKDAQGSETHKVGSCLLEAEHNNKDEESNFIEKVKKNNKTAGSNKLASSSGTQLRTFRFAMAATGEFTASNGGTAALGFAALVSYVNRINAVFRNELSINLSLVSGTNLVYTDSATDPFDQNAANLNDVIAANHTNLNTVIGNANYDFGHLIGFESGSGQGIAVTSSVCNNNYKGYGLSFVGTVSSYGLSFMDNLLLHEMGHQFGMSHSYNSTTNVCTTRRAPTSVEPGAGTTIMSYGYICGTDNYPEGPKVGTVLQYHSVNYEQAISYLSNISCQVSTPTNNTPPVVSVPINYTIPKSTPFSLTGSATDVNNDNLTYCWEGTNIGTIVPDTNTINDTTQPPFFRSYPASSNPTRTYPVLSSILDGSNQAVGDKLPSIGIVTTHSLTVRDNNAAGGGVTNANVTVTIDENTGPFLITSNTYPVVNVLTQPIEVTWSVNGTNIATPNVNILLSIDGGLTFPYTLESNVANDGSHFVTIPRIPNTTDKARIKVEAVGNIFFDISNTNFTIIQPMELTFTGTNVNTASSINGSATVAVTGGRNAFIYNRSTNFTNAPYSILGSTITTFSTITVPALPANETINSAFLDLTNVVANSTSFRSQIRAALTGAYTLSETRLSSQSSAGTISPNPSIVLPNFPSTGGSINLRFRDTSDNSGVDATVQAASIRVNFTRNGYTYLWSNGATTPTISNVVAGTYSVTVTDASGNQATGSYTVSTDYSITASSGTNGTISPAGTSTVVSGGSLTYTFTPNTCFKVGSVLVNGTSVGAVTSYTFPNITSNQTISVSFIPNPSVNTTNITTCSDYTWANNNQVYTTSGIYTGTTTGCVTEQLNLIINQTTWNGTSWSNGLPNSSTKAIINGNYSQSVNLTACNLEINGTAVVSVPSGFNFTISGKVTIAPTASLTFENNANLVQLENSQNTGFITVKRNTNPLSRLDYTIWSSPVTNLNQRLTDFSPFTTTNRFYNYNESTNFYNQISSPSTTAFELSSGYLIRIPNNHPAVPTIWQGVFTGVPNNGVITKSIYYSGSSLYGYNLIGNPYPSVIDAESFVNENTNQIEGSLYFWRKVNGASGSSYAVYNKLGSTRTVSSNFPNGTIQVGQGFFVKAKAVPGTVVFKNSMRLQNNENQFFKSKADVQNRFWINLTNKEGVFSQLLVGYLAEASTGVDLYDAKYINDSPIALTSIINGEEYSIQAKSKFIESDSVSLGFKTEKSGEYQIALDRVDGLFADGQDVFLTDNTTGEETNLKEQSYLFYASAKVDFDRFSIKYTKKSTENEQNLSAIDVKIYIENGEIHVKSKSKIIEEIKVYDVLGRELVYQKNINSRYSVIKNTRKTNQVLIVKTVLKGKIAVTKKINN